MRAGPRAIHTDPRCDCEDLTLGPAAPAGSCSPLELLGVSPLEVLDATLPSSPPPPGKNTTSPSPLLLADSPARAAPAAAEAARGVYPRAPGLFDHFGEDVHEHAANELSTTGCINGSLQFGIFDSTAAVPTALVARRPSGRRTKQRTQAPVTVHMGIQGPASRQGRTTTQMGLNVQWVDQAHKKVRRLELTFDAALTVSGVKSLLQKPVGLAAADQVKL